MLLQLIILCEKVNDYFRASILGFSVVNTEFILVLLTDAYTLKRIQPTPTIFTE